MAKAIRSGRRNASALGKTGAGRSAYVMNPEYLAEIEHFRLMDDTFMSKCLENALKSGEDFDKLRDTYVIFITENDVMGGGKDAYWIARTVRELGGRAFGDGTHIIYVNGATRSKTDIGKLMHDFLCSNAAEMYFDILKRQKSVNSRIQKLQPTVA